MYVCVCNAVNERRVREAIREGRQTVGALREYFGFESCCGRCTGCMRALIVDHGKQETTRTGSEKTDER